MPFYDDEPNNNPFRPTFEQQQYGFTPEELRRHDEIKHEPSFAESFGAGFESENWLTRTTQDALVEKTSVESALTPDSKLAQDDFLTLSQKLDAFDYRPFLRDKDQDYIDWFAAGAAEERDIGIIQKRVDELLKRKQDVENGGIGSFAGMVTGAILSPELILPVIGEASILSKGKLGTNLMKVFGTNVAADSLHEFINYKTDRNYDTDQAGAAILGSFLLNAAFGGLNWRAAKKLAKQEQDSKAVLDAIADDVVKLGEQANPHTNRSVGAAQVDDAWELKADDLLRKIHGTGLGSGKGMLISNNLMGALSKSRVVRKITGLLYENSFYYKKNAEGIAMPASAELRLERRKGATVNAYKESRKLYNEYAAATTDKVSEAEFRKLISRAIREGNSENPFVAKAAKIYKKDVFNPLLKDLKRLGLIEEGIDLNPNYLNRVWDREKVLANRAVLKTKLVSHFAKQEMNKDVERYYLEDAADDVITNMLGGDIIKSNHIAGVGSANPLKGRALDINESEFEDFLVNDIEVLADRYNKQIGKVIEKEDLLRDNGWKNFNEVEREIRDEYNALINAAKPEDVKGLQDEMTEAIEFVATAVERTFGTGKQLNKLERGVTNALKVSTLSKLGSVLIASLGDIARITQEFGNVGLGRGLKLMVRGATKNLKQDEYEKLGALTERVLNERYNALAGIDDAHTGTGIISNGIDRLYRSFGKITFMDRWNNGAKMMAIYAGEHSLIDNALKMAAGGTLDPKAIEEMARWGIDKTMAERIGKMFKKHGREKDGLYISNFEDWTDGIALDAYANSLTKMSLQVINTPTKGVLPTAFDSTLGRAMLQFKSFMFASHAQTLVPMLQTPDAKRMIGSLEMISIGALAYYAKEQAFNKEPKEMTWQDLIAEGIDKSGLLSIPFEVNNIVEKATGNVVGVRPLLGLDSAQRYRNINVTGALMGPLPGMVEDIFTPIGHAFQGDLTKGDVNRLWRLAPYQNYFLTRHWTNKLRDSLAEKVDD